MDLTFLINTSILIFILAKNLIIKFEIKAFLFNNVCLHLTILVQNFLNISFVIYLYNETVLLYVLLPPNLKNMWIGLVYSITQNKFIWDDNSEVHYTRWGRNEPTVNTINQFITLTLLIQQVPICGLNGLEFTLLGIYQFINSYYGTLQGFTYGPELIKQNITNNQLCQ